MPSNPRIDEIATRVDSLQKDGYPFLSAISQVAETLDMSVSVIDSCYAAALTGEYDLAAVFSGDPIPGTYWKSDNDAIDPFDTTVDDWQEAYWR